MREKMSGVGMELVKVVFLFSMAVEMAICAEAVWMDDASMTIPMMLLILVPVVSVLVRRLVPNFFLFTLIHLAMAATLFLYPDVVSRVIAGVYIGCEIVYIYVRKTSASNDPLSFTALMCAFGIDLVLYLVAAPMEYEFMQNLILGFAIVQTVVYMIYFHQLNVQASLQANVDSMDQSTAKLGRINTRIIIMYVVVLVILVAVAVLARMDVAFSAIGQLLLIGLGAIVRLIFNGSGSTEEGEIIEEEALEDNMATDLSDLGEPTSYMFWEIIERILIVACVIAIIIGIGYVLYRFYKRFMSDRIESSETFEYQETTMFVEKAERVHRERRPLSDILNLSNEKRVRRIYAKKIQRKIHEGTKIQSSETVQEIRKDVTDEDLTELTQLYEKARYSDQPITKEELKRIE